MSAFTTITDKLSGRHTAAIMAFFITGNVLQYTHRLDANYIYYMTVLMGFVLGHSVKEDIFAAKDSDRHDGAH